jgi:signal transduction histidine kinase
LVETVCRKFQDQAAARQLGFRWQVPSGAEVVSDSVLLGSVLTNLVDNAVEYTPRGGTVTVAVQLDNHRFKASVVNTVEHFDARDLNRLFDRFWRKDAARSGNGHIGLGLSLARDFARALGGELTAHLIAPDQLEMRLVAGRPSPG